jgi:sugar phosphate permease
MGFPATPAVPTTDVAAPNETFARWRILALLALAMSLGMSLWFTASATATQLAARWDLDARQAAALTTSVQLGFVIGTALAAVFNLADIIAARIYFAFCAFAAAIANVALVVVPAFEHAIFSRFLTGFFLAGVYPPAMKMVATWFRAGRGLAIGVLVGALTVGKATPYLVSALATVDFRFVALSTSAGAVAAAVLVAVAYSEGPHPFPRRPFSWSLVGLLVRHRETRLAIGGYLGHMWELYACWTALSIFFLDFFRGRGYANLTSASLSGVFAFASIAVGGVGSVLAGAWADRLGREFVAGAAMAVSGACALALGWLTAAPVWIVAIIAIAWGFAVVADSAQFSALVTEVAPTHAVGTALTMQTSLGFLLTAASIWLTIEVAGRWGWGAAFSLLAVGPAFGIWQMWLLDRTRKSKI